MFGAYIADTYLGRYNTVCWAVLVAMVGHVLLIISAIPTVISKPNVAIGVFAVAIVIMGVGTGKPPEAVLDQQASKTLSRTRIETPDVLGA